MCVWLSKLQPYWRCVCIYIHVCMYVYMYVCMYVCMYMYVYMYVCIYICIYVYIYVYMYVYMYVCMYVCMYVYMYVDNRMIIGRTILHLLVLHKTKLIVQLVTLYGHTYMC